MKISEFKNESGWVASAIVNGDLPWNSALRISFEEFSKKYTLHDSTWVGIFADVAYDKSLVLAFKWDSVWLPEGIYHPSERVANWPILFIRIPNSLSLTLEKFSDIERMQRGVGRASVVADSKGRSLIIEDHYGASVVIVFQGDFEFLALDNKKTVIKI
jgi:hypothetical protein